MLRRTTPTSSDEQRLLEMLEREREFMKPEVSLGRYAGIADYLLHEAEFFELPNRSVEGPLDVPGFCYANAYRLARRSKGELRYAEGYALAERTGILHIHAWCVSANGRVVDSTWHGVGSSLGLAYFGKVFELTHVARVRRGPKKSASVIDDWRNGFPLLK